MTGVTNSLLPFEYFTFSHMIDVLWHKFSFTIVLLKIQLCADRLFTFKLVEQENTSNKMPQTLSIINVKYEITIEKCFYFIDAGMRIT